MFVRQVRIIGLRSVDSAVLDGCGQFNILIGKNNSGKSNLLAAILGFFRALASGTIVNLEPMFGSQEDFFNKNIERPIEIECSFDLLPKDRQQILQNIATEFPQIRSAVVPWEGADTLSMTVKYFAPPYGASLVTRISLKTGEAGQSTDLLSIPDEVGPELHRTFHRVRQLKNENSVYQRLIGGSFDSDDFARVKSDRQPRMPIRFFVERYQRSGEFQDDFYDSLQAAVAASANLTEFQQNISQRIAANEAEAVVVEKTPVSGAIQCMGGQQHVVPEYVRQICDRISQTRVLYQSERRDPIGPADAHRLLNLRVKRGGEKLFRTFQETVATLIGVEIEPFIEDSQSRSFERERPAQLDVDSFLVQANGSGIKEALRLMINIELDQPTIMLIEEPEVHLHPALESSVMRYLKKKSEMSQLFLTSHSTNFIDSGEYSAIYFVKKDLSTTSTLLTMDQASETLPEELGLRLSSLFMFERLVFVEGPSDEDVIREWAATLNYNLSKAAVGFIQMGGSRNIHHFSARKMTDFLTTRGVTLWFMRDKDEMIDGDIDKFRSKLGENCHLCVLPVREIENYLVDPETIKRALQSRLPDTSGPDHSLDALKNIIDQKAESLRSYTLGKKLLSIYGVPLYFDRKVEKTLSETDTLSVVREALNTGSALLEQREQRLDAEIERIKSEFDEAWRRAKLEVIPGEELLQAIFGHFGLAYKKQRDARLLASCMEASRIPLQVRDMLSDVAPKS